MAEHEDELKNNPESDKDRTLGKEGVSGGAQRKEEKPAKAQEAKDVDKGWEKREKLFKDALEKVKQEKKVSGPELAGKKFDQLIQFLKKKEKGDKIPEKDETSLWKLLLAILKTLWKEIKKLFKEEQYEELMAVARAAGAKNDEDILVWLIAQEFPKERQEELLAHLKGLSIQEEKSGERQPKKEETVFDTGEERGKVGGGQTPAEGYEFDYETQFKPDVKYISEGIDFYEKRLVDFAGRFDYEELTRAQGEVQQAHRLEALLDEEMRRIDAGAELTDEGKARLSDLKTELRRNSKLLAQHFAQRGLYGPHFYETLDQIEKLEIDGVLKRLKPLTNTELEALQKKEGSLRYQAEQKLLERREAKRQTAKVFNNILAKAERDPRSQFQFMGEDHQLLDELLDRVEAVDVGTYFEYQSWWLARRFFHSAESELAKGGNPEMLGKAAEAIASSEDRQTIVRMEEGLGVALRQVEKELARVRRNPKHEGRIPFEALAIEGGGEDAIVNRVGQRLYEMSKAGLLFHIDEGGSYQVYYDGEEEARQIAIRAFKVLDADGRPAEFVAQSDLPAQPYALYSPPREHMVGAMNPVLTRLDRFGEQDEAMETAERLIQGMKELLPRFGVDEKDLVLFISPSNLMQVGGEWSVSTWRALTVCKKLIEDRNLALAVQYYGVGERAKKEARGDKRRKDELEGEYKTKVFTDAGKRFPSRMMDLLPASMMRGREQDKGGKAKKPEILGKEPLREGIVELKELQPYAKLRARTSTDYQAYEEVVKKQVDKGIISQSEADKKLALRFNQEVVKQAANRAQIFLIRDTLKLADEPPLPGKGWEDLSAKEIEDWKSDSDNWEEAVWKKWDELQEKLFKLEEVVIQKYYQESRAKGERGVEFPSVLAMVNKIREKKGNEIFGIKPEALTEDQKHLLSTLQFSDEEEKLVERLSLLGGKNETERDEIAKALITQEFDYALFLDDVFHEETRWGDVGPRGYSRRFSDMNMAKAAADELIHLMAGTDSLKEGPATRGGIVEQLTKMYHNLGQIDPEKRQKIVATAAGVLMQDVYMADSWVEGKQLDSLYGKLGPIGSMIKFINPLTYLMGLGGAIADVKIFNRESSVAQRRFGKEAISLTTGERYALINQLRPLIGAENAKVLQKLMKAGLADVAFTYWRQYLLLGLLYWGYATAAEFYNQMKKAPAEVFGGRSD